MRPYGLARLVAATGMLIALLAAATSAMLFVSYHDALHQQETNLRNLSIAFAAQTFSVVQAVDQVMLQVERSYRAPTAHAGHELLAPFEENSLAQANLIGIQLFDQGGRLIAARGPGVAATRVHAMPPRAFPATDPRQLHITITDIDPVTGRGIINFSRTTADAFGQHTGTIQAQADSERFERIYSLVELGRGGSVTLFHRDGTMLVRGPNLPAGIGHSFATTPLFRQYLPKGERGAFAVASPLDGKQRLYGYDAVSNYPLVIISGMDRADALIEWYGRLWTTLSFFSLFSLTVMFLAWRVARDAARLAYVANFDVLTGLPNHIQFRRILEAEVASAAARGGMLGTFVVSLERVHEITDLLGHEAGDVALKYIGQVFQALLPRAAGVARIKSNEFAVVIPALEVGMLDQFALELHERLSQALTVGEREFYLGPVIGVALFPQDGTVADQLFRRADSARNRAGTESDNTIHFFCESTHSDLDERLMVEAQLRRALERREFRVVYQPKVDIRSGRIVGFEALLRWSNPLLGEVSPVRFIPIAERTGLITPIGAWVLNETCRQVASWAADGGVPVKVAVNLSPRQFYQKDLLPMIRRCMEGSAFPAGSLELEITETALMSREQEVDVLMREIRALGVELSIDDFGTGYSSLAYLKRLPVQRLKIDRAFIHDLGRDEDSDAIVRSIINLAHGLKLAVVAEGVETEEQLAALRSMACDEYQGFLFSRPVAAEAVLDLVLQNCAACA